MSYAYPYARIGQTPGLRMRCRSRCEIFSDTSAYAVSRGTITSLTTVRVLSQLPNGWSQIQIETGPRAGQGGVVRTENLVLVPSNVITLPEAGPVGPVVVRPEPVGEGPFVPGGSIDVNLPGTPPVPAPTPPPDTTPPGSVSPGAPPEGTVQTPPIAAPVTPVTPLPAPAPWYETAAELLVLTSPLWGAVLLSKLLPPR